MREIEREREKQRERNREREREREKQRESEIIIMCRLVGNDHRNIDYFL